MASRAQRLGEEGESRALDAACWAFVPWALLVCLRHAYISADGLGNALSAAARTTLNPNHLLFVPLDRQWLHLTERLFSGILAVDRLRWLSALYGALALSIFRYAIAPRLANDRRAANFATAAMALGAGFLQMWLSAECHILQMPALALSAAAFLRWRESPSSWRAAVLGFGIALNAICFVSLAGLLVSGGLLLLGDASATARERWRGASIMALTCATLAGGALWVAWRQVPDHPGFLGWVTSYSGEMPSRLHAVYGLQPSLGGIALAGARAAYGSVSSLVELTSAYAAWRDQAERWPLVLSLILATAFLVALARAWSRRETSQDRAARALGLFLVPPTFAFAWFWNNSEAQFYIPVALVAGALVPRLGSRRGSFVVASVLAMNAAWAGAHYAFYPRAALRATLLHEVDGACAVVVPGFDDASVLLRLGPKLDFDIVSIADLAVLGPAAEQLPSLTRTLIGCLASGRRVVLVNLFDRPPYEPPWKFLRALGYSPERVQGELVRLPLQSVRRVYPFTFRTAVE